jgi:hypothetical protein
MFMVGFATGGLFASLVISQWYRIVRTFKVTDVDHCDSHNKDK